MKYLRMFLPSIAEVCGPLRKLTSIYMKKIFLQDLKKKPGKD